MGTIIVGVDGSTAAQHALEWALREARLRGDSVTAIHNYSYTPPDVPDSWLADPGTGDHLEGVARQQAQDTLEGALELAGDLAEGIDVRLEVTSERDARSALIDRSQDAELLVVGSRGKGGIVGLLIGSVSRACVEHAACPVLVVRGTG